jgi:hypothetical protein
VLDRLLSTLEEGGIHTPTQLAGQLGVSDRLVEQMLADLSHMGYLRPVSNAGCQTLPNGNSGPCADCALAGACVTNGPSNRVWVLTDKAFR